MLSFYVKCILEVLSIFLSYLKKTTIVFSVVSPAYWNILEHENLSLLLYTLIGKPLFGPYFDLKTSIFLLS